jgi:hypothetical protein
MRFFLGFVALALASCSQPASAPEDAAAGSTGVGRVETAPVVIEPEALVGVWSFDRSCASGDGMRLNADGTASFDEWGQGTWSFNANDNRVLLNLNVNEMGVGPTGETRIYSIVVMDAVTDDLNGRIEVSMVGEQPRGINAKRCPE